MARYVFTPPENERTDFHEVNDPYWKLIINRINWEESKFSYLRNWDRSTTTDKITWGGDQYIGLSSSGANSAHLTQKIYLPTSGWYWFVIKVRKHPLDSGIMQLYVDGETVDDPIPGQDAFERYAKVMYHLQYYEEGYHDFDVYLTKQFYCEMIGIYRIEQYIACSDESQIQKYANQISVDNISITSNSTNEAGTLTAKIPFMPEFRSGTNRSGYIFDFCDHVSLILGQNEKLAQPVFPGYVLYPQRAENHLELNCIDRLLDSQIQMVYRNLNVGNPATENTNRLPTSNFGSVYEMVRHLGSIWTYPINVNTIPYDHGFYLNFANVEDFNKVAAINLELEHDFNEGNPRPSLKVLPGELVDEFSLILYNDAQTFDAKIYESLFIDYSNLTGTHTPPIPFNIRLTMHREGESIGQAQEYEIVFAGDPDPENQIGVIPELWNGGWPGLKFDLKTGFETKTAGVSYNVSKIELVGEFTEAQITERLERPLWIDNAMSNKTLNQNPILQSSDVRYISEIFKDIYEGTKHIIWVQPGVERCDDVLMCVPESTLKSLAVIDENWNVREVESERYDPLGDGICNRRDASFTLGEDGEGRAFSENIESQMRYKEITTFETLDVANQADADRITEEYIQQNAFKERGAVVILDGNVLFGPAQVVETRMGGRNLEGLLPVKTINQELDILNDQFTSQLDLNKKSRLYNENRKWMENGLTYAGIRRSNTVYAKIK